MSISQQMMFALQSPVGLRFGTTISIESDRITFEMDLQVPKGIECPFRVELSGSEETVMGTIRVERVIPKRGNALPRYIGRILQMADDNRETFDAWRRDIATGGVSRKLERDPEALEERMAQPVMSGLSQSESRAALERMNQRRASYSQAVDEPQVDLGLSTEQESASEEDQQLVRERLRQKALQTEDQATPVGATVDFSPTPVPTPAPPPAPTPTPAKAIPGSSFSPPLVVVNIDSVPIEITVIYLSREALRADYQATLQNSALTIDDPRLTELYQPVDVKIQLPDGASVEVSGQTVAQTPNGMAVALDLDATQRALIETVNAR
jgi:hypothetical protein